MTVRILVGDAMQELGKLPDESVHCCVTSPPYWGLRSYGGDPGMIGLEPTFEQHLANLVQVFREVLRVLRSDGTVWLNYGDAYAANTKGTGGTMVGMEGPPPGGRRYEAFPVNHCLKPKDLLMMPARVAMALQADGWWLRSEIIWHKPNPMPESVTDRPTSSHEKLFLLSKAARYFYDAEAVRVVSVTGDNRRPYGSEGAWEMDGRPDHQRRGGQQRSGNEATGANLRNVWKIATHSFREAHFATFPPKLVQPCIRAGTSERGVCADCGAPWVREVEKTLVRGTNSRPTPTRGGEDNDMGEARARSGHTGGGARNRVETLGWHPTCDHATDPVPATCLDPFAGAGTVGLVADRLGRDAILIEINPEYADMARDRIANDAPLFAEVR